MDKDLEKFFKRTKNGAGGCLEWTGPFYGEYGYPQFSWKGKQVLARRFILIQTRGRIESKIVVAKCHNKLCVNPDHLISNDIDRFYLYTKPGSNGCLIWTGSINHKGYAVFNANSITNEAYRWIYGATHGYFPPVVRHKCDNPLCVSIHHLEGGTQRDNIRDALLRGQRRSVPAEKVRALFEAVGQDGVVAPVAKKLGISMGHSWKLVKDFRAGKTRLIDEIESASECAGPSTPGPDRGLSDAIVRDGAGSLRDLAGGSESATSRPE